VQLPEELTGHPRGACEPRHVVQLHVQSQPHEQAGVLPEDACVLPLVAEDGVVELPVPLQALVEYDGVRQVVVLAKRLGAGMVVDPRHPDHPEHINLAAQFYHGIGRRVKTLYHWKPRNNHV